MVYEQAYGEQQENDDAEQLHRDEPFFNFLTDLVRTEAGDNGVHMWTHIAGEHGSSTRMEVAVGVLALHIRKVCFIGSDSKSMVDKASWLI